MGMDLRKQVGQERMRLQTAIENTGLSGDDPYIRGLNTLVQRSPFLPQMIANGNGNNQEGLGAINTLLNKSAVAPERQQVVEEIGRTPIGMGMNYIMHSPDNQSKHLQNVINTMVDNVSKQYGPMYGALIHGDVSMPWDPSSVARNYNLIGRNNAGADPLNTMYSAMRTGGYWTPQYQGNYGWLR